jgi:hypothetical protein
VLEDLRRLANQQLANPTTTLVECAKTILHSADSELFAGALELLQHTKADSAARCLVDFACDDTRARPRREAVLALGTDSGEIYFSGSLSDEGMHQVETGFGKVHLVLPADAAFDLDAETDFGSIKTDFAVMVSDFEEQHMIGEVNGGGPSLQIRTDSGSITLVSATNESN